jgi:hypothetical protein
VQRNVRPFEHHQQFGLVGVQPREQTMVVPVKVVEIPV